MAKLNHFIGIDISKSSVDVAFLANGTMRTQKYEYTSEGIQSLIKNLSPHSHCVMENTGVYHLKLAYTLYEKKYKVSVVNPLQIKRFIQSQLKRTKTDKQDAIHIQQYASIMPLDEWKPNNQYFVELRQLFVLQNSLIKQKTRTLNQIEAIRCDVVQNKKALQLLKKQSLQIEKLIEEIDRGMNKLLEEHPQENEDVKRLESIPGIGKKVAIAFVIFMKDLKHFENHRQVCSYLGLSPREIQSGTSVKCKSRICKMGMNEIRRLLYMSALSAIRYNKTCKDLFERLVAKGKCKKLALIAVCNKLIKQAFALIKHQSFYDKNFPHNLFAF